jgi:hypothetical protein
MQLGHICSLQEWLNRISGWEGMHRAPLLAQKSAPHLVSCGATLRINAMSPDPTFLQESLMEEGFAAKSATAYNPLWEP